MNPSKYLALLILVLLLGSGAGVSAQSGDTLPPAPEPVRLTTGQGRYPMGFHLEYLADPSYQLTLSDVTSATYDTQFVPGLAETLNFGYGKSAYWVRFQVKNDTPHWYQWLLEITPPFLDNLEVHHLPVGEPSQVYILGDLYPFAQRPFNHRNFVLNLSLPPDSVHTFYIRFQHVDRMIFNITLWNPVTFSQKESLTLLAFGFFFGTLTGLMLYNLLLFVSIREIVYFYYSSYAASIILIYIALDGYGFQYIWPNQTGWQKVPTLTGLSASVAVLTLLTLKFLQISKLSRIWLVALRGIIWVAVGCLVGLLIVPENFLLRIFIPALSLVTLVILFGSGLYAWWRGYKPARFYLAAWGAYFIASVIPIATVFAWLPANVITQNATRMAFVPALLLLSIALADRINTLKDENEAVQARALNVARENERLVREQNVTLEKLVAERTQKLVQASRAKSTFLANVSHELRTPLGLVEAAVKTLRSDRLAIDESMRRLSLETIADETYELTGMVDNLLAASRMEQHHVKLSLTQTDLTVLLQKKITAWQAHTPHRRFNLHAPAEPVWILLDATQIQRVLRNLLQNAVKYSFPDTTVTITLTAENEGVLVAVQDQGYGIAADDQANIFERFYRGNLKSPRAIRGVGLGLAICREIVQAHGGRIWLESEVGQGSAFFVQLPWQPAELKGTKI